MALTPVQKITQAADTAEAAANVLEQIVEGDGTTTVTTIGGRTIPSVTKWYADSFLTMETFITAEANRATTQANTATTQASAAAASAASALNNKNYSQEWANNAENVAVSVAAGGDGSTTFSSKHHAIKSAASAAAALVSENNAGSSAGAASSSAAAASASATAAQNAQSYAEEWANNAISVPVSVAAGGDGSTTFSALHWADVAENASHTHTNKAILDLITAAGSGIIISAAERTKLAGIETAATADQIASEVPFTNTTSGLAATQVQAALDEIDGIVDGLSAATANYVLKNADSDVSANIRLLDTYELRLGTSSDLRLKHDGTNSLIQNYTGLLYLTNYADGQGVIIRAEDAGAVMRNMIVSGPDTGVELFYNGVKKIESTSAGATVTGALTVTSDATIQGNLTVQGAITYVDSNTVEIGDNIILLNRDEVAAPSQDAGFEIERGTSANVSLLWKEASDYWSFGNQLLGDILDPTAGSHVGDRDYNDARYILVSNYTDASVLAKVKNVDGAGSGLDADLLDGNEGALYLLKSEVNVSLDFSHTLSANFDTGISRFYTNVGGSPDGGFFTGVTVKSGATRGFQLAVDDTLANGFWARNQTTEGAAWNSWKQLMTGDNGLSDLNNDMWEITSVAPTDGTGKPNGYIWFVV